MDFSNLKSLKSCSLEEVKERLGASKKKTATIFYDTAIKIYSPFIGYGWFTSSIW